MDSMVYWMFTFFFSLLFLFFKRCKNKSFFIGPGENRGKKQQRTQKSYCYTHTHNKSCIDNANEK